MSNSHVDPSDLHLKRELTALRKTKYLRDPETSSSWRSPLSSRTVLAASNFNHRNKSLEGLDGKYGSFEMYSVEPDMPFKGENKPTEVFLYNWRQHSGKYGDGGKKFDQCVQSELVSGSPEHSSIINMHRGYSVSCNSVIDPVLDSRPNQGNGEPPSRRVFQRFKNAHKQGAEQNLISVKSIGPPLNLIYQSDDTEGNSEDVHIQPHKFAKRIHHPSYSTTPLSSQYENWSLQNP